MFPNRRRPSRLTTACLAGLLLTSGAWAQATRLVQQDGRHALLVDGRPFLMLGGQTHNSSSYPKALDEVWAAVADLQANTVEVPIAADLSLSR